jgi:uroporphyrinogen-III synthase
MQWQPDPTPRGDELTTTVDRIPPTGLAGAACAGIPMLLGHAIALTGHRRSDELAAHLQSLGAEVLIGSTVHTRPVAHDDSALRAATLAVLQDPPTYLLATTGIGVRGWINAAASWRTRTELLDALVSTHVLARGPKVVGALSEAGLAPWFVAASGRTADLVEHLLERPLAGVHVALQLPGEGMDDTVAALEAAGARVTQVPVYEWTWPDDLEPARRALRAVATARVSAVVFTSRPAVRHFVALAAEEGLTDAVGRALAGHVLPVCIGPSTADALRTLTGASPCRPERAMLGALGPVVADELRVRCHHHLRTTDGEDVVVQRRLVHGRGRTVLTSDREAALLDRLVAPTRRTVPRADLLRSVWGDEAPDSSVLDATMGRLRRRLQGTGLSIRTVAGRGYLLDGDLTRCPELPERGPART